MTQVQRTNRSSNETLLPPRELLSRSVAALLRCFQREAAPPEALFEAAFTALAALPLATGEYLRATASVRNAQQYVRRGEPGAARYEVRLLERQLAKIEDIGG